MCIRASKVAKISGDLVFSGFALARLTAMRSKIPTRYYPKVGHSDIHVCKYMYEAPFDHTAKI